MQVKSKVIIGFLLGLILSCGSATVEAADLTLMFKPQVEISGARVLLGDLAVVSGPDCALKTDLAEVYITRAPSPGRSTKIRRNYLEHRLRASGLPLDLVEMEMPGAITVTRQHQTVDEAWVLKVVRDYLTRNEPYQSHSWQLLKMSVGSLPLLPLGELSYTVSPVSSYRPTSLVLNIFLSVDGKNTGRIRAACKIKLSVGAIVAARPMEKNHVISPGDLKLAQLSLRKVPHGALTDVNLAYGKASRRRLKTGQVILTRDLVLRPVVERGDMVTIVAENGPIRVTVPGQIKRDGVMGENVPVLNLKSKKIVMAEVVGSDKVLVKF